MAAAAEVEGVAAPVDGVDELEGKGGVHFAAEAVDGHAEGVGVVQGVDAPDCFQQVVAGDDFAVVPGEGGEEAELGRGEAEFFPGTRGLHARDVDLDIGDADDVGVGAAGPAEEGADAGHEFLPGEGFGKVVVGAHEEAFDALIDSGAAGEDEDGHVLFGLADFAEDAPAGLSGEHDVEQDEGEVALEGELQPGGAVGGDFHDVAGLSQPLAE